MISSCENVKVEVFHRTASSNAPFTAWVVFLLSKLHQQHTSDSFSDIPAALLFLRATGVRFKAYKREDK